MQHNVGDNRRARFASRVAADALGRPCRTTCYAAHFYAQLPPPSAAPQSAPALVTADDATNRAAAEESSLDRRTRSPLDRARRCSRTMTPTVVINTSEATRPRM